MHNPKRWMLVANNGKYHVYNVKSPKEIEDVKEHVHRKAMMREQNYTYDQAGSTHGDTFTPRETHRQLEEKAYAKELAHWINTEFDKKHFEWLYLAMAPDLLGYVREHLSKAVQEAIHKEVDKDVVSEKPEKVWERYFQV